MRAPLMIRTVHLPEQLDDRLKQLAFDLMASPNDATRALLRMGLVVLDRECGNNAEKRKRFLAQFETEEDRHDERELHTSFAQDIERLHQAVIGHRGLEASCTPSNSNESDQGGV